ncbi:helix-turn-helix domain-containing protein [Streptomyces capitiformicae]|uniref:Transcriptional regulator n=1 Tax=Streptomyces capitiformicae TaxID=2014920 RepID=A0A919L700_9ACTN|nr:helix-turn-helix transcriptional regulator [Streptomyces capitiformicae]GHH87235.1 transcriptional regulator [Streptomyces capitiformicae]
MPQRRTVTGRSQEPRKRFAEEVRALRERSGQSLRELAEQVGWDASQFSRLENGLTLGGPEIVEALDQHYGTPGLLLTLWELAVADPTQFKEQYRQYMLLEAEAVSLWHYAVAVLPGVLQHEYYARELLRAGGLDGGELDAQVEARMGRRELLLADTTRRFRTVLSEVVLHSPLSDPEEWRGQLEHLLMMGHRVNVTVQVLPLSAGLHGLSNTDTMFLRGVDGRTVAWVETGYSGELVQETTAVEQLQLRYDLVRDSALSPDESRQFIERMLKEAS